MELCFFGRNRLYKKIFCDVTRWRNSVEIDKIITPEARKSSNLQYPVLFNTWTEGWRTRNEKSHFRNNKKHDLLVISSQLKALPQDW